MNNNNDKNKKIDDLVNNLFESLLITDEKPSRPFKTYDKITIADIVYLYNTFKSYLELNALDLFFNTNQLKTIIYQYMDFLNLLKLIIEDKLKTFNTISESDDNILFYRMYGINIPNKDKLLEEINALKEIQRKVNVLYSNLLLTYKRIIDAENMTDKDTGFNPKDIIDII